MPVLSPEGRRHVIAGAATTALAVGVLAFGAGPAAADPYNCDTWAQGQSSSVGAGLCTNGTGTYKVVGECSKPGYPTKQNAGFTVRVGNVSSFDCGSGWSAVRLSIRVMS